MIVLFFGQPASGKTTLAKEFSRIWSSRDDDYGMLHIDGDEWREITNNNDYSKSGRMMNLKNAFNMALYLERMKINTAVSFVTPYQELRNYLSERAEIYCQIYLTCDEQRGRESYFVPDFEKPEGDFLMLNTSSLSIIDCLEKVFEYVEKKASSQNNQLSDTE